MWRKTITLTRANITDEAEGELLELLDGIYINKSFFDEKDLNPLAADAYDANLKVEAYLELAEVFAIECVLSDSSKREKAEQYVEEAKKLIDLLIKKNVFYRDTNIKMIVTLKKIDVLLGFSRQHGSIGRLI